MDPDRARELLTTELSELDDRARFAEESRAEVTTDDTEAGEVSQHSADQASDVNAAMDTALLVDTVADQRRLITDALTRLDAGTYGTCAVCGTTIDDERLAARPEVATCREHADTPVVT